MSWHVYIAKAWTGRYYTGISKNPNARIKEHNSLSGGAKFAHDQGPFTLVYTSDSFSNQKEARAREKQIKVWSHEKKEKLIKGKWK